MKLLALFALFAVAVSASATNYDEGGCRGNCTPETQAVPTTYNLNPSQSQGQAQGQLQGQAQGQGQSQSAAAVAGASAGAFNANDIDVRSANTNVVGVGVDTSDYNSNSNRAEGGTGIGVGGHQAQGIVDSGNSESLSSARGGDQSQSQGVYGSGNSANSNSAVNQGNNAAQSTNVTFEAAKTYKHTPSMGAPSIYASGVCSGRSAGIGLAGPGYGVSLGGTGKNDAGCELRETARLLGGLGYTDTAFVLLCMQVATVREANGGSCTPPQEEPPVVIDPPTEKEPPVVIVDSVKG